MITNERQYRIAKAELKRFEEAVAKNSEGNAGEDIHPRIRAAMDDALESEADELRRQLGEYEALREGRIQSRTLESLSELPTALIQARIASRITQKTLAGRLGVAEQQVQRWEASDYSGVSVSRVQDVADALAVRITKRIDFAPTRTASATKKRRAGETVKARSSKSGRSASKSARSAQTATKGKRSRT